MDGRLLGKVLWFNSFKGYGEIVDSFGKKFFFLAADCERAKGKSLEAGTQLTFLQSKSKIFGRPKASAILFLTKSQAKQASKSKNQEAEA